MQSRGMSNRQPVRAIRSQFFGLLLSMLASVSALYVANRLWLEAESKTHLTEELHRRTAQEKSAITVEEAWELATCRERQKKLSALEMELVEARKEGFISKHKEVNGKDHKKRILAVIGITTSFGRKKERDLIRKKWMKSGEALRKMEAEKGIIVRFVVGQSANRGDRFDREIDMENKKYNDFFILDSQVEAVEEGPNKTKSFLTHAVENWDADFYIKVNDDVHVNIDALSGFLATHLDDLHVYIGCMKSGKVFSDSNDEWYEPEWWKFGDKKSYFQHASKEFIAVSRAVAQFISINRSMLRTYAHDDVSIGSWLIGLDVKHINEEQFCCNRSPGAICGTM